MKKFIFVFSVLLWAWLLIFISFGRDLVSKKDPLPPIDFSEGRKFYTWNANAKSFLVNSASEQKSNTNQLSLDRFSPVDGIYYTSNTVSPIHLTKNGTMNTIMLGSGFFVSNIQSGLEKYEFQFGDLTLMPKGRGVFMIDTRESEVKVFSFDAFIDVALVSGAKRTHVTNFTLFPSLLFKHDSKNTSNLRWADILRISLIDSIRYVDLNVASDRKLLLGTMESTFLDIQKDIDHRFHAFKNLYDTIVENKTPAKTNGSTFFDTSSPLLINDSKKAVFLKNELIAEIVPFFSNPKTTSIGAVTKTLADMKELNAQVYMEWLSILKQYYYIVRFAHFTDETGQFDASAPEAPLIALAEKAINPTGSSQKGEYYTHLSDLFSVYYFSSLKQEGLNNSLESILQKILDTKVLSEDEFLPFVFFTTQYLSTGPILPNEDTMKIIDHLFHITNEYYLKNKADSARITTITSTIFYNYTKIFSKLYGVFISTFVDKTSKGLLLKTDYVPGGSKELSSSFIETFTSVIADAKKDTENKREAFYASGSARIDSQVVDSYTLLNSTIKPFDTLVSMFNNYPKYLNDFHLNDSNKVAQGILVNTGSEMSLDILKNYLKNFNNLDLQSLQVTNNFLKDGFYEVQVNILGNTFHFKLWEQDHAMAEISYIDTFGQKKIFPNASISLDQKEKQLKELFASTTDLTAQYRYDFKNFFETTFLRSDTAIIPSGSETPKNTSSGTNSPEIQLFIQRELLDKDFKNIANFLSIEFKNIRASIDEAGEYVIDLNNINKTFTGKWGNYVVEMSGKYLFKRHAFSRLAFKVRKEGDQKSYDFNAIAIEILPARISLLTVPDTLKDLGHYLDVVRSAYANGQSIILDLNGKKVILDSVQVPVNIGAE